MALAWRFSQLVFGLAFSSKLHWDVKAHDKEEQFLSSQLPQKPIVWGSSDLAMRLSNYNYVTYYRFYIKILFKFNVAF